MDRCRAASILAVTVLVGVLCFLVGCEMVDPERPTPQPDTQLYGNLMEVEESPGDPGSLVVRIRVGMPRALGEAKEEEGRPTPTVEKGITAEIAVGADTVVLRDGRPAAVEGFNPGTEVVALPVMGTTRMVGHSLIRMEATYLMDFDTYRAWKLPGLGGEIPTTQPVGGDDPARINTAAIEHAPIPVGDGTVLYFAARQRLPSGPGQPLIGPDRPGLEEGATGQPPQERSFRTELGDGGWTPPAMVAFPGLESAEVVRVSWIDPEETLCLVTVEEPGQEPWVGQARRTSRDADWGAVERMEAFGEGDAVDAIYLAGSRTKLSFISRRWGISHSDLFMYDPKAADEAQPLLDRRVNTPSNEWSPRVGPYNELFFCRGDRQLLLAGGTVGALRPPGPHRVIITEAAATHDGRWVFLCMPRFTPVELDQDIYVAEWGGGRELGEPVAVDDWRP